MKNYLMAGMMGMMSLTACNQENKVQEEAFDYTVEQFADLQLLRYKVHGFEELPLKQKELVYYLQDSLFWKDLTTGLGLCCRL